MGKRGPKAGATQFIGVSLGELNRVLKEDATVLVSRKFSDMLNIEGKGIRHQKNNKHVEAVVVQPEFKIDTGEDNDNDDGNEDW